VILRTFLIGGVLLAGADAVAQDAARGARLFADTARATGGRVAACATCHADTGTLREQMRNRGVKVDDAVAVARRLDAVVAGASPGATGAKAQYRGVLTATDIRDLAAYLARAKQVGAPGPAVEGLAAIAPQAVQVANEGR
jgi:cytochrome c553